MQLLPRIHAGIVCLAICLISLPELGFAYSDGDLRLRGGNTTRGWLEIYYRYKWYSISNRYFIGDTSNMARVACRQLGLPNTQARILTSVNLARTLDNIGVLAVPMYCNGDETRYTSCPNFSWLFSTFESHDNDIGLHCLGENLRENDLRLVDGSDERRGRLEVYKGDTWETFCSVTFDVPEATVACRQLGLLNSTDVAVYPDAYFGQGYGYAWNGYYIAHCSGSESRIDSCTDFYRSIDSYNADEISCSSSNDVGICCPSEKVSCPVYVSGTTSSGSVAGSVVGAIIFIIVVILAIACCCYCCCKKNKPKQQYTTVVQNPVPQPATTGGPNVSIPPAGSAPPVYYHGAAAPGYPVGGTAPPQPQGTATPYPPTGPPAAMPPPGAGGTPYPPQPYPYPAGQAPPATAAYPAPQQPGYNPTAATTQPYPQQPTAPYPPPAASMQAPYGAPSAQPMGYPPQGAPVPSDQPYPSKGDADHPLPTGTETTPSAPPMSTGHNEVPSAPPPAYEHLLG